MRKSRRLASLALPYGVYALIFILAPLLLILFYSLFIKEARLGVHTKTLPEIL